MVPSISSLVAATLACEFVASLPGPAAWAENVFLPERKVALVAASQPVGHDDLSVQGMMQVKLRTAILHGSTVCNSCRMQQPHWCDGQSRQQRQTFRHLASSFRPHAIALQASIHVALPRFWPGEIDDDSDCFQGVPILGNGWYTTVLSGNFNAVEGAMGMRKGRNDNCRTRHT